MPGASLRIEIDERPLLLGRRFDTDYVTRLIRSAVFLGAGIEAGAQGHEVVAQPRGIWSTGAPVEPEELIETLTAARTHRLWRLPLAGMRTARVDGGRVVIELAGANSALGPALAAPELAPTSLTGAFNGPYVVAEMTQQVVRCRPNPHISGAARRPALEFVVNRDVHESPRGFAAGGYDITCNTGFPYGAVAEWRNDARFRQADSGIWVQLDFSSRTPLARDPGVRQALWSALDLPAICRSIGAGLVPARSFGPMALAVGAAPLEPRPGVLPDALRTRPIVAIFNDYYPNRALLEAVAEAWARAFGLTVTLSPVPFGSMPNRPYDLQLTLNFPHYDHPLASLSPFIGAVALFAAPDAAKVYGSALTRLRGAPPGAWSALVRKATFVLGEVLPCLPLATVQSLWLQNSSAGEFRYAPDTVHDFSDLGAAS